MIKTSDTTKESENVNKCSEYKNCPLTALSSVTTNILAKSLNNLKILHSENGYERDWRGLATLAEQRDACVDNYSTNNGAFEGLLTLWCENKPETAVFGNLILYLGLIDRWHIIEDAHENLLKDYQAYQLLQQTDSKENVYKKEMNASIAVNKSNTPMSEEHLDYDIEAKLLTSNDVQCYQHGLPLEQYDAFILYADNDYKYALEILAKLQNNHLYNFTFCLKDDLLFGIPFEHMALMELIRERCKYLIAVLTKEFTKSPENRFFVNYAQALQIKQEIRKVIPLLYEDNVEIPANLAMFSRMRYNPCRTDLYWSKLADSMQLVQLNERVTTLSPISQCVANTRRLQAIRQQRNLAIEGAQNEKLVRNKKSTTKAKAKTKHHKTKAYTKTSLRYSSQTHSVALTPTDSHSNCSSSSNTRTRSFFKRLICCC